MGFERDHSSISVSENSNGGNVVSGIWVVRANEHQDQVALDSLR